LDHVNYRSNKHSKKEESSMNKKDMKNNGSGYPSIMWVKKQNLQQNCLEISVSIYLTRLKILLAYKQQDCINKYNGNII
jgi:hypothetical protein